MPGADKGANFDRFCRFVEKSLHQFIWGLNMSKKNQDALRIDPNLLKAITGYVIDRLREEERTAEKSRHNKKRANVKLLLRNYRSLSEHSEGAIYDAAQAENDLDLIGVLDLMKSGRESIGIDSIRSSVARTRLILDHINEMLEIYKRYCDRSPREEDRRRYRVVYDMYISPEPMTLDEIAAKENIDRSTVYRDVEAASERLTALIFGIDGLDLMKR
jgi:predicted DNA-binding protein YlxM (UPF0122 family)